MYYGIFHLSGLIRALVYKKKITPPPRRSEVVESRKGTANINKFIGKIGKQNTRRSTIPTWQAWLGGKAKGRRREV